MGGQGAASFGGLTFVVLPRRFRCSVMARLAVRVGSPSRTEETSETIESIRQFSRIRRIGINTVAERSDSFGFS